MLIQYLIPKMEIKYAFKPIPLQTILSMSNSVHFVLGEALISFDQDSAFLFVDELNEAASYLKINSSVYELVIEIDPNRSVKFIPDFVRLLPASDGFILTQYKIDFFKLPFNDKSNPYIIEIIEASKLFCIFASY